MRPSGAHSAQTLAVEVQQCPLCAEVGEEFGVSKTEVNIEMEAEVEEEKEEEEKEEKKKEKNNSDKI